MKSQPKTSRPDQPGRPNSGKRSVPARRKRARALSPKQFVNILEHMKDGLVVPNKDRHYVYVSQKAAEMLQRQEPSDLVGKHIWTEFAEGVGQPFQMAYEKGPEVHRRTVREIFRSESGAGIFQADLRRPPKAVNPNLPMETE